MTCGGMTRPNIAGAYDDDGKDNKFQANWRGARKYQFDDEARLKQAELNRSCHRFSQLATARREAGEGFTASVGAQ